MNITTTPDIQGGKPCIKGTRIAVEHVLRQMAAGDTEAQLLAAYPNITSEDVRECLRFALVAMGAPPF